MMPQQSTSPRRTSPHAGWMHTRLRTSNARVSLIFAMLAFYMMADMRHGEDPAIAQKKRDRRLD